MHDDAKERLVGIAKKRNDEWMKSGASDTANEAIKSGSRLIWHRRGEGGTDKRRRWTN